AGLWRRRRPSTLPLPPLPPAPHLHRLPGLRRGLPDALGPAPARPARARPRPPLRHVPAGRARLAAPAGAAWRRGGAGRPHGGPPSRLRLLPPLLHRRRRAVGPHARHPRQLPCVPRPRPAPGLLPQLCRAESARARGAPRLPRARLHAPAHRLRHARRAGAARARAPLQSHAALGPGARAAADPGRRGDRGGRRPGWPGQRRARRR
ncbi:hypothetical protein APUTEX25_004609, partial [Auxenochlorella protothecoides]